MNRYEIISDYEKYKQIFLEENSRLNLISKNDEKYLYEKHFYDSLSIKLFFEKYNYMPKTMLDIGTGGGFPSVPIAMEYPQLMVSAIDSIRKKTTAVQTIAEKLGLTNLDVINDRVENLKEKGYDLITSRAVGKVDELIKYSYQLLNPNGYIVLYKSKTANEEIDNAKPLIRRYRLKIHPPIEYSLPLSENYTRVLLIFQR